MTEWYVSDLIKDDDGFRIVLEDIDGVKDEIVIDSDTSFDILKELSIECSDAIIESLYEEMELGNEDGWSL